MLAMKEALIQEYMSKQEYFENIGYEYGGIIAYQFAMLFSKNCNLCG